MAHLPRKNRLPVRPDDMFLGGLTLDASSTPLSAPFEELLGTALELHGAYRAHAISSVEMAELFAKLRINDEADVEWTLGATSLNWYSRQDGQPWAKSSAPEIDLVAEPLPDDLVTEARRLARSRRFPSGAVADAVDADAGGDVPTSEPAAPDFADPGLAQGLDLGGDVPSFTGVVTAAARTGVRDDESYDDTFDAGPFGRDGSPLTEVLDGTDTNSSLSIDGLLAVPGGSGELTLLTGEPPVVTPTTAPLTSSLADLGHRPAATHNDAYSTIEGEADDELLRRLLGPES